MEREILLSLLLETEAGKDSTAVIKQALERLDYLTAQQKAFLKYVFDGCNQRRITLDYILDAYSKTPVRKMKPVIRSILRMAVFQILYMDSVPDSAATNEAVKLAKKHGFTSLSGFVNGVLRTIIRNREQLPLPGRPDEHAGRADWISYLSVCYAMPQILCEAWFDRYGAAETEAMLAAFLVPRPISIRVSEVLSETEREELRKKLLETPRLELKKSEHLPYAYELSHTDNVRFLYGFEQGMFAVQDVSSMLVTEAADPQAGDTVIDVCSAPGGKTMHAYTRLRKAAQLAGGKQEHPGQVISRDLEAYKCDRIRENADRLFPGWRSVQQGLPELCIEEWDARIRDEKLVGAADVLYCDLPCSGWGILGRKNDIKYHAGESQLSSIEALQKEIMRTVLPYLKEGGILLYSTCTIRTEENEAMVDWLCREFPLERVDLRPVLPASLAGESGTEQGYLQLLPHRHGTDGFFLAKLRKKKTGSVKE